MKILVTRRVKHLAIFHPEKIDITWEGKTQRCKECGCHFLLEPSDKPRIFARIEEVDGGVVGVEDFTIYIVFCPEGCGSWVKIGSTIADIGERLIWRNTYAEGIQPT